MTTPSSAPPPNPGTDQSHQVPDFIEKLLMRRLVTAIELGSPGRTKGSFKFTTGRSTQRADNRNRRRVTLDKREVLATQTFTNWNQMVPFLPQIDQLRAAA